MNVQEKIEEIREKSKTSKDLRVEFIQLLDIIELQKIIQPHWNICAKKEEIEIKDYYPDDTPLIIEICSPCGKKCDDMFGSYFCYQNFVKKKGKEK